MTILDSGSPFSSLTLRAATAAGSATDKEVAADVWHPGMQATDLMALTRLTYGGVGTALSRSANIRGDGIPDAPYDDQAARTTLANFGSKLLFRWIGFAVREWQGRAVTLQAGR